MPNYRRPWIPGATYFFTIALCDRRRDAFLVQHIDVLRTAVREVRRDHPFEINGWVVLPDHMHCILTLPRGTHDFATRIRRIKTLFSQAMPNDEARSAARQRRGQRGIWQNRYWEHWIRDELDFRAHLDYVHINPVKHGYAKRVLDWPYSTFHRCVAEGLYPANWAGGGDVDLGYPD